ncbi:PA domain-containing protein [uncultured Polaribacter sp.]|uniref:PA domain-containing protein n=1 Tax=uncultured Polaribacter sp. TaxID=174711 RepID=UPI00260CA3D9|nr:PA domain-containing protein [uncultured Polaribacter sp.]
MKKIILFSTIVLASLLTLVFSFGNQKELSSINNSKIKSVHKKNIEQNPFKETLKLSKLERKAQGLTPNKYNEEQWILTMNPELGRPTPIKVAEIQKELLQKSNNYSRTPGDDIDNMWINRGPNNVGGRTRALMFDPNDATDETVFAGGVSGGLWKNSNISNENSVWERVGIPENLAVSSITFDPNDTNVFYVGTGESYVGHTDGSVNGDGIWKSIDGGSTWTNIFGGNTGVSYFVSSSNITVNSPSEIAGDYQSFPTTNFGPEITSVISAEFIMANDSADTATEACNSFGDDATGKIAVIRRGNCDFVVKVKNAQDNGAIAVIMLNNVSGEPIPMGGEDSTITIPAVMISKETGDLIEAALETGTVSGSLNPAEGNFTAMVVPGIQHINDIKIKNNEGVSEIYVAAADALYGSSNSATTIGGLSYGLYKSIDGGDNWTELSLPLTEDGNKHCPNDIEIDSSGKIWVSTTQSKIYGDGGGEIFSSSDGVNFSNIYTVTNGSRTQIAVSSTSAGKIYVLAELTTGGVTIISTTSGFVPAFGVRTKTLPDDADTDITANDFTRGQAFYDLLLEVAPNNDDIVYTGGIDLFKSTNGASSWNQISHWYGGFGYQYVHSDQHIAAFGHNDSNKVIFGNDGGVAYSSNGGTTIVERTNGLITSQFYTLGVGPTTAFDGDYFAGGLQDNGTVLIENGNSNGPDSSTEIYGGDGAYTFMDQDGTDRYIISNYVYNGGINLYNFDGDNVSINSENESNGAFINPQALDSNLDILYSNYSASGNYIVKRYSGIKSTTTLTKTDLTDELLTTTPTAFTVSPHTTTSSTLLIGTILGDVLLVENADSENPTWTGLDENRLIGSISDLEFGQTENDIFVTLHNYGVNNIYYSSDKGVTWQAKDGNLPDLPVKAILQNPLNLEEVIIGTELGVWYTSNFSDTNPTWLPSYNGMSNVKVLDLDLRDDNMVFAATHGRGVFSGQFTAESLSLDENILSSSEIKIYPTVSNGIINIKSLNDLGETKFIIYNLSGQKMYSDILELSNNESSINLSNFSSGVYLIKFSVEGNEVTHKFIIN